MKDGVRFGNTTFVGYLAEQTREQE
jgi:hypothetical protein